MSKDSAQLPITDYRLPIYVLRQACSPSCDRTLVIASIKTNLERYF
ncbi:MAG: hypothetical protein F6K26_33290 [Moorea sp. SIO2I5]|nr:hypothetical protein [Moorena sp. SIO2I5]